MDLGPLIPIVAILSGLGWGWLGYKKRELNHKMIDARREVTDERAENERLKQRVAVLEKIVTDRGAVTADQIEALRDQDRIVSGEKTQ
ncbi:MAG TPA: hypothetical protein VFP53_01285 [Sphingomicrobium sp.]|nr:hypothetical protein [Sphingomicrobium sp.]